MRQANLIEPGIVSFLLREDSIAAIKRALADPLREKERKQMTLLFGWLKEMRIAVDWRWLAEHFMRLGLFDLAEEALLLAGDNRARDKQSS